MDLQTLLSFEWSIMAPEFIILGFAVLILLCELFLPEKVDRKQLGWLALASVILAFITLLGLMDRTTTSILEDTFRLDAFAKLFKLLLLFGTGAVIVMSINFNPREDKIKYQSEFYYLMLAALLGAMIMSSSGDLITLFVGLELLSIASYILVGIRKTNLKANESALKYVINGSIATAITLFGFSYVYGITGTTNLREMGEILLLLDNGQYLYLLGLAFFTVFVGLSFKIATVPFHMWAPDVYEGAATPVTAFLSVVSKTAGFVVIIRVMFVIFAFVSGGEGAGAEPLIYNVRPFIAVIAAVTMIIGNVVALRQTNIKRMLAYSSVAHAGYMLVAIASLSVFIFDIIWYYLFAYMFMTIGAFAVIQIVTERSESENITEFAGLYRRSPLLAVLMGIFILSLAGIPITAGFIGKLSIFIGAFIVDPGFYVLASIMIGTTIVSYFYYFGVMKQMFFVAPGESGTEKFTGGKSLLVVIVICALATVLFGLFPNVVTDYFQQIGNQFGDMR